MKKQVITITENGEVSGLQRKPGQGLDLTKLGRADVVRVSEIMWDADAQRWFIQVITGPKAGTVVTLPEWVDAGIADLPAGLDHGATRLTSALFFQGYDEAVAAEIAFLDALRLKGIF